MYKKSEKPQAKPINVNFQSTVQLVACQTLAIMNIVCYTGVCTNTSDTSLEWDTGILQIDAKGTGITDREFKEQTPNKIVVRCGTAQTSLTSTVPYSGTYIQRGLQLPEIDSKPVYTMISGMRWGFSETKKFHVESYGIVNIPHTYEYVDFEAGKSPDEMRIVLKNPALWKIVQVSSVSSPRSQGSVPSEDSESQDVEQLDL